MGSLDARLKSLLTARAYHARRVDAGEAAPSEVPLVPDRVGVLVKFTGNVEDLKAAGLAVDTVVGNPRVSFSIATGSIALDAAEALAAVPHVTKVELSRPLAPEIDVSVVEIKAKPLHGQNPPFRGKGVVVGIIDDGLDYRHHAFRFSSGGSRLLFLWDQSLTARPRGPTDPFQEAAPPEFPGLGVEYNQKQISDALATKKATDIVRVRDNQFAHGTHVTGIAAGDGSQSGTKSGESCTGADTYIGVAPEADIIFVRNQLEVDALGRSNNLVSAIQYIFMRAAALDGGAGRPCVINISQGDNLGPHDGTSLVEQAIDLQLIGNAGRAIVKSAGNEGNADHHAFAAIPPAGSESITFDVRGGDTADRFMECWYHGSGRLDVQLTAPGTPGPSSPVVSPGASTPWPVPPAGGPQATVTITSTLADPENLDNQIYLEFRTPAGVAQPNGPWTVTFTNTGGVATEVHCWLDRGPRRVAPVFTSHVQASHTISIPGTAATVLTVGAYAAEEFTSRSGEKTEKGDLDIDSSRGPTRTGGVKPDISAPGVAVTAARADSHGGCCCDCCYTFYVDKSGTSMAAPHVTGVIALMLQKNRTLDWQAIRNHILASRRIPDGMTAANLPNNDWGAGKIDASAAVAAVPTPPGAAGGGGAGGGGGPVPFWISPVPTISERTLFRRLQGFQNYLLGFPSGHHWAALVSRHFDEVLALINTNRRVATVWHRNGGPALVRAALELAEDPPAFAFPEVFEDERLTLRFDRILASWRTHASPELAEAIDLHRGEIVALPGRSLHSILTNRASAA